jgi:hypothetical protein
LINLCPQKEVYVETSERQQHFTLSDENKPN